MRVTTAIDSSVLWALSRHEPGFERWHHLLVTAGEEGPLLVCPVVFAELAPSVVTPEELLRELGTYGIEYSAFSIEAAHLAGLTFEKYRKAGGPRERLIPDFLIAAHAQMQADRLATADQGFQRRWFPKLSLLTLATA